MPADRSFIAAPAPRRVPLVIALGVALIAVAVCSPPAGAVVDGGPLTRAVAAAKKAPPRGRVDVGIGQQTPDVFSSPLFKKLKLSQARYIAPWDALKDPVQRAALDQWVFAAVVNHVRPMIGFAHSLRSARLARVLPSPKAYQRAFIGFRRRYPQVHDWVPWNEANPPTALTGPRPDRAARYFDIISHHCSGCRVVAADVLDVPNMAFWIQRFLRHVHHKPKIWGLHNYHDANAFTPKSTRRLLSLVHGQIWFTETGGVVKRRAINSKRSHLFRYSLKHAARATKYALDLTRISKRIRRVYLYHWRAPKPFTTWDSALVDAKQRSRPAYRTLRSWLKSARRTHLAR